MSFSSTRLKVARDLRGKTKRALADGIGVSVRSLVAYESETQAPEDATVDKIAAALDFPREFFFGEDIDRLMVENICFRALTRMTAGTRKAVLAEGEIARIIARWINDKFTVPPPNLPDLSHEYCYDKETTEDLAVALRSAWGIGVQPVSNMLHLVERNGVKVFSLASPDRNSDGFSFWDGNTPFILFNDTKTAERGRFDIAHELGHLLLHKNPNKTSTGGKGSKSREMEANLFASAFLMPKSGILATAPHVPTFEALMKCKKYWKVSFSALLYRLHHLNLITDWTYRDMFIRVGKLGHDQEPEGIDREESMVLKQVDELWRSGGHYLEDIARAINVYPADIAAHVFGLFKSRESLTFHLVK